MKRRRGPADPAYPSPLPQKFGKFASAHLAEAPGARCAPRREEREEEEERGGSAPDRRCPCPAACPRGWATVSQ